MREIVVLQIGHCGNSIGTKFWEVISDEHGIQPDGKWRGYSSLQQQRVNVYYQEARGCHWVPRVVCVDLDKDCEALVRGGPYGTLISPDSVITDSNGTGTGNNFAKGFYSSGPNLLEKVRDEIRKSVEECDSLQGFQLCHSLGGGTGSGFGSLLQSKIKEEYPDKILNPLTVYPSSKGSDIVVEPYNCILSLNHLIESPEQVIIFDNGALNNICKNQLKIAHPTFMDLNHLVSLVMAGTTACFRFPGQLNTDLRKLFVNMVPFPRLHFFSPTTVPLYSRGALPYSKGTVQSLVIDMFNPSFSMCEIDPRKGKFLTAAAIFRGRTSTKEVEEQMVILQARNSYMFSEFIPNNIKTAICDIAPRGQSLSASFLGNNTGIQEIFRRQSKIFKSMFHKKAFLHWFTDEGMEENEFHDANVNVQDLISEYQRTQEFTDRESDKRESDNQESTEIEEENEI